jgi:type I restriction enzyme R subunit
MSLQGRAVGWIDWRHVSGSERRGRLAGTATDHDEALWQVVTGLLADHEELFKQFGEDPSFEEWLAEMTFSVRDRTGQ